jgi:hypothetical protein
MEEDDDDARAMDEDEDDIVAVPAMGRGRDGWNGME